MEKVLCNITTKMYDSDDKDSIIMVYNRTGDYLGALTGDQRYDDYLLGIIDRSVESGIAIGRKQKSQELKRVLGL